MKNLFVGNLSFQTTESDLRALFEPFGQMVRVHMAMDRETGRARGFGFVEMANDEEAKKAIAALDGKELGGRNVKINEARPKEQAAASFQRRRARCGRQQRRRRRRPRPVSKRLMTIGGAARQPREPRW